MEKSMSELHKIYIHGKWVTSDSGQTYEHRSPADLAEVTGVFQKSSIGDTRVAIEASKRAFEPWAALSVCERADYLKKAHALMIERVYEIARVITAENGKTLAGSKGEIASAIREMDFQINQGLRMAGEIMPSSMPGVLAYQIRRPLGPVAVISPWNFPFNVPTRKMTPALISGNTCVLKPAQLTSAVSEQFVKLFDDAGWKVPQTS